MRAIDQRLRDPKPEYLEELEEGQSLFGIGLDSGIVTDEQEAHVLGEVFGGSDSPRAFWPKLELKQEIVRAGYIQALRIALAPLRRTPPDRSKPIVSYWVVGPEDFEIMVAESAQEVTVFLLTPRFAPPAPPRPPGDIQEDLWVIAPEARIAEIRARFPPAYNLEDPKKLGAGVQSQRVKGY